uniref:C3H1-type domain-containing protein n=1 Tax=Chromera velia CCMP2878 TaxID=1169474 RepID=A0A0G4F1T4_9ALVE|eukprot:Cvel_2640.t1-p1 / transcript=Cvel_2640.t1 / gene=Cvel_2640 / organism=Chromera_velia_CCMP2878 / gene_product=hypothetical protein / transcript_product=hypothetical protein / location=Cvel_scaffold104:119520-124256(-) / protein_length=1188 / sequence_SO=supercontig / SO=protein_coding / is_pseudo=false
MRIPPTDGHNSNHAGEQAFQSSGGPPASTVGGATSDSHSDNSPSQAATGSPVRHTTATAQTPDSPQIMPVAVSEGEVAEAEAGSGHEVQRQQHRIAEDYKVQPGVLNMNMPPEALRGNFAGGWGQAATAVPAGYPGASPVSTQMGGAGVYSPSGRRVSFGWRRMSSGRSMSVDAFRRFSPHDDGVAASGDVSRTSASAAVKPSASGDLFPFLAAFPSQDHAAGLNTSGRHAPTFLHQQYVGSGQAPQNPQQTEGRVSFEQKGKFSATAAAAVPGQAGQRRGQEHQQGRGGIGMGGGQGQHGQGGQVGRVVDRADRSPRWQVTDSVEQVFAQRVEREARARDGKSTDGDEAPSDSDGDEESDGDEDEVDEEEEERRRERRRQMGIPENITPAEAHKFIDSSKLLDSSGANAKSIGSMTHDLGLCKPCVFVHNKGCRNDKACLFCHEWHPPKIKKRRHRKRNRTRRGTSSRGSDVSGSPERLPFCLQKEPQVPPMSGGPLPARSRISTNSSLPPSPPPHPADNPPSSLSNRGGSHLDTPDQIRRTPERFSRGSPALMNLNPQTAGLSPGSSGQMQYASASSSSRKFETPPMSLPLAGIVSGGRETGTASSGPASASLRSHPPPPPTSQHPSNQQPPQVPPYPTHSPAPIRPGSANRPDVLAPPGSAGSMSGRPEAAGPRRTRLSSGGSGSMMGLPHASGSVGGRGWMSSPPEAPLIGRHPSGASPPQLPSQHPSGEEEEEMPEWFSPVGASQQAAQAHSFGISGGPSNEKPQAPVGALMPPQKDSSSLQQQHQQPQRGSPLLQFLPPPPAAQHPPPLPEDMSVQVARHPSGGISSSQRSSNFQPQPPPPPLPEATGGEWDRSGRHRSSGPSPSHSPSAAVLPRPPGDGASSRSYREGTRGTQTGGMAPAVAALFASQGEPSRGSNNTSPILSFGGTPTHPPRNAPPGFSPTSLPPPHPPPGPGSDYGANATQLKADAPVFIPRTSPSPSRSTSPQQQSGAPPRGGGRGGGGGSNSASVGGRGGSSGSGLRGRPTSSGGGRNGRTSRGRGRGGQQDQQSQSQSGGGIVKLPDRDRESAGGDRPGASSSGSGSWMPVRSNGGGDPPPHRMQSSSGGSGPPPNGSHPEPFIWGEVGGGGRGVNEGSSNRRPQRGGGEGSSSGGRGGGSRGRWAHGGGGGGGYRRSGSETPEWA